MSRADRHFVAGEPCPKPPDKRSAVSGCAGYDRWDRCGRSGHPKRSSGKNAAAPTVAAENRANAIANALSLALKLITALAKLRAKRLAAGALMAAEMQSLGVG